MESPGLNTALTESQNQAVQARGNVLVMAGAGTGKTKTLVERCLHCLEHDGAQMDELLVVTFTEAAAAEMRQRLRRELESKAAANPELEKWPQQLALFDLAPIGTLHSFCLKLIREHFFELELDPRFTLLDEGEARQRAGETLDELFKFHYEGAEAFSLAVQDLIQIHGGGRDEKIRSLILKLHHYSQTRPHPAGWLAEQLQIFSLPEPATWREWLLTAIDAWRHEWLPILEQLAAGNEKAVELNSLLQPQLKNNSREEAAHWLEQIIVADANWPAKRKTILRKPLEKLFAEAGFLRSVALVKNGNDPLAEDWQWVRHQMETLMRLAQDFAACFAEGKRRDGVLDFHDLEQFALKLLWNFATNQPAAPAAAWQKKIRFVLVDEYQDINAAQDKIIEALSRHDGNRFLVGDVKQSIYRFRLADPKIFRDYARSWQGGNGTTISLAENFRSESELLEFVNSVCGLVMREAVGGVAYDDSAKLKSGREKPGRAEVKEPVIGQPDLFPPTVPKIQNPTEEETRVELLLRLKPSRSELADDEGELSDLDEAQKEARLAALHLAQLVASRRTIWDDSAKSYRPIQWHDIAILLRSPGGKSEIFAKEFERVGVPLAVARGKFYQNAEILDLLSLLQLLDNPLQDVPCIAVLRSPLVSLSLNELAAIRLAGKGHFWTALMQSHHANEKFPAETNGKISRFLASFLRWRKLAKLSSLSECLETVLAETLYADWLRAQPGGSQRAANVANLLSLAQRFDQFQRQGLFRFLKFVEAQQEAETEPEVPPLPQNNAVQLMSIHQSKGLEFPVVVLADLAKSFNEQDLRAEIIFDEAFGLCPKIKPPGSGRRYPSLPHWLAQRRQKQELRGEELRLLYVALTRAREHLILTASITAKKWDEAWRQPQPVGPRQILEASSFADWLALWFAGNTTGESSTPWLGWRTIDDADLSNEIARHQIQSPSAVLKTASSADKNFDEAALKQLEAILAWKYPFQPATERKAKTTVTALRREAQELAEEAENTFPVRAFRVLAKRQAGTDPTKLSAAQIGAAHHKFLQHVKLETPRDLAGEAERLVKENYLSAAEAVALDLEALNSFWNSSLGQKIWKNPAQVRRELPFTARFSPAELQSLTGRHASDGLDGEFIVVQGVADLVVQMPSEIWIVDFKTDEVGSQGADEKVKIYAPQLKLYAAALEKIYTRKVTLRALHFLGAGKTVEV